MYARVARWEGANPDALRQMIADLREQAEAGGSPPGGVAAVGGTVLVDVEKGTSLAILLFETEGDMRSAHEVLDAANSPRDTGGRRVSVEMFEVGLDVRAERRTSTA